MFDAGLINSVTDFAVYTQHVSGIDFAFFEMRQVYHTIKDQKLPPGKKNLSNKFLLHHHEYFFLPCADYQQDPSSFKETTSSL